MQAEGGGFLGFVPSRNNPVGFIFVASLEGLLFPGNEVFAVVNAPRAKEDAVCYFGERAGRRKIVKIGRGVRDG